MAPRVFSPRPFCFLHLFLITEVPFFSLIDCFCDIITKVRITTVCAASCYPSSHASRRPDHHGLSSDARNRYIMAIKMPEISARGLTQYLLDNSEAAAGYTITRIPPEGFTGQESHNDG